MGNQSLKEFYEGTTPEEFMRKMRFINLCIYMTMDPLTVLDIVERAKRRAHGEDRKDH